MRVRGKSRLSARTSKRKNEAESSTTAASEPQPKRMSRRNEGGQKEPSSSKTRGATVSSSIMVDKYCWICHTETDDKICVTCRRAFHHDCLKDKKYTFNELGVCTECQSKSVNGTELSSTRFLNIEKLKRMLDVLTRRSFDKKRKKNEPFLRWQEDKRDELFKIIDFEILLDNINHVPPYTKTAEFYGDVKFIYHNSCIAYGAISDEAKAAENLRRDFKTELLDLEACPECFYYMYCDESDSYDRFIRLCDSPHDIVWAQLTGHPYWPAKCLKVLKGVAHVRFFGEHEQSNIPIKKCFFMSKSHPKYKNSNIYSPENSGPKSEHFQSARIELLKYIRLYETKYGHFPFYPHKTPYKLQEKQNEVIITSAEGSLPRNVVQMKLEGILDESETNVINAATVMEFSEENLDSVTNDIRSPNESFKELYLKSLHPEGNGSLVEGQYSTPDELLSSVVVDATLLASASVDSGLCSNSSPVTSINMVFSSEENPPNIESPLISSNPAIDSSSPTPHDFELLQNMKRIRHSEASAQETEIQAIPPRSLDDIFHPVMFMENQDDLDTEVQCIGQKSNIQGDVNINPDIILPVIEKYNPALMETIQQGSYYFKGLLLRLWAKSNQDTDCLERISKLSFELRRCTSTLQKLEDENLKLKKEEEENNKRAKKLESENKILLKKIEEEKEIGDTKAENAKIIIQGLKNGCVQKLESQLKAQYMAIITEKDNIINASERKIKCLEEEKRQLEKSLHLQVAKESDIDDISRFKKTHYCKICELPAAITCCLNTSYCGPECQDHDAEAHRQSCEKPNITGQIVKETVCQKTIYAEMSTINKSLHSQEISVHQKRTKMISESSMLPTSQDYVTASSSRHPFSKMKNQKFKKQH